MAISNLMTGTKVEHTLIIFIKYLLRVKYCTTLEVLPIVKEVYPSFVHSCSFQIIAELCPNKASRKGEKELRHVLGCW